MSTIAYLKSLVRDKNVASITPSSSFTVKKATQKIDFSRDIVIVEFGPGTGVFADYLLKKMTPESTLIMIELNPEFAKQLRTIDDKRAHVHEASAEKVGEIVKEHGFEKVDYFLSGIPFSFLDDEIKTAILTTSSGLLKGDGYFLAYQTSGHLKEPLGRAFDDVQTSFEIRNIPPMTIYEARNNGKL